jgi:uncharacterized membrane protein YdjX (TVP38/TMEM64 family)
MSDASSKVRVRWRAVALIGFLIAIISVGYVVDLPDVILVAREVIQPAEHWAPLAFGAGYVAATMLGVPGTPLTVVAALMFGAWTAFVVMVAATTAAALASFIIARYVARDSVQSWMGDDKRFRTVRGWVEHNPWMAIPFARIMPLFPFALCNYGLGLTRLSVWKSMAASELAMIPMNAVLIGLSSSLYGILIRGETAWWLAAGTVIAGLVILALGLAGKRRFEPLTMEVSGA